MTDVFLKFNPKHTEAMLGLFVFFDFLEKRAEKIEGHGERTTLLKKYNKVFVLTASITGFITIALFLYGWVFTKNIGKAYWLTDLAFFLVAIIAISLWNYFCIFESKFINIDKLLKEIDDKQLHPDVKNRKGAYEVVEQIRQWLVEKKSQNYTLIQEGLLLEKLSEIDVLSNILYQYEFCTFFQKEINDVLNKNNLTPLPSFNPKEVNLHSKTFNQGNQEKAIKTSSLPSIQDLFLVQENIKEQEKQKKNQLKKINKQAIALLKDVKRYVHSYHYFLRNHFFYQKIYKEKNKQIYKYITDEQSKMLLKQGIDKEWIDKINHCLDCSNKKELQIITENQQVKNELSRFNVIKKRFRNSVLFKVFRTKHQVCDNIPNKYFNYNYSHTKAFLYELLNHQTCDLSKKARDSSLQEIKKLNLTIETNQPVLNIDLTKTANVKFQNSQEWLKSNNEKPTIY